MSIQLFGNNIRISLESSIAVRLNSDNIELWKHHNFCMCVTEVWSQGQVHAGHVLYLLLVPPPPSLLIIFEIESPRLVLSSLCISGRALIYDPTASASTMAGNGSLFYCYTTRVKQQWRLWQVLPWPFSGVLAVVCPWSGSTGPCQEGLLPLHQVLTVCCPCCETEASSAWRHQLLPVYHSGALIFLSLACALELPLGKCWSTAGLSFLVPLSHGKDAVKHPQRTRCPSLPKQTKNDSTPISTLKG